MKQEFMLQCFYSSVIKVVENNRRLIGHIMSTALVSWYERQIWDQAQALWIRPCGSGSGLVDQALWIRMRPCGSGSGLVDQALWSRPCGAGLVDQALWIRPCGSGSGLVDQALWIRPCGSGLVDQALWSSTRGALQCVVSGANPPDSLLTAVARGRHTGRLLRGGLLCVHKERLHL